MSTLIRIPYDVERSPRWTRVAVPLLLMNHAALLAWIGYRNAPTLDEVVHLPAGLSHWYFGDLTLYKVNPPLVRSVAALPVLLYRPKTDWSRFSHGLRDRSEFPVGRDFLAINGKDALWYHTVARWACIPFSVVGGYFCYRWGRELHGATSGLLALTLWCFSPNVLGNASMTTPDVPAAALGLTSYYFFCRWLERPNWRNAALAGVTLGAAELAKTIWIVFLPLFPAIWLFWRVAIRRLSTKTAWMIEATQLCVILLCAIYLINLAYAFEGSFRLLKDYDFVSQTLGGDIGPSETGNRFANYVIGLIPIPLPVNYLEGIDLQRAEFESPKWSYLRGEQRLGGWWYWYSYAMLIKAPLGTIVLLMLAIRHTRWHPNLSVRSTQKVLVVVPAVLVFVLVSSQTGFSRYLRYVLPAFPFAYIWIGKCACCLSPKRRVEGGVLVVALCWSLASSLTIYPHSLSYFNEMVGGPLEGHLHLADANIDWGQDLLYLKRWMQKHPRAKPMKLAYFGFVAPKDADLDCEPVTRSGRLPNDSGGPLLKHEEREGGWYAISVNELVGYSNAERNGRRFARFLHVRPAAYAGYSIRIFDVSAAHDSEMSMEFREITPADER